MGLTKAQLEALNDSSFPNNNVGAITPEILRTYNDEVITNTVNQDDYTADSTSFDNRINAITASGGGVSIGEFNSYTASQDFKNTTFATTSSLNSLSASVAVVNNTQTSLINGKLNTSSFNSYTQSTANTIATLATTASVNSLSASVFSVNATQSSLINGKLDTASFNTFSTSVDSRLDTEEFKSTTFATTASNTFIGNQLINGNVNITGSLTASGLKYPTADNGAKSFIQTDGAGNLSLQYVDTIFEAFYAGENVSKGTPLYFSGSQGANPIAYAADASNPNKMPVVLIASDNLTAGNVYEGIVLGLIEGLNLTGYTAGQTVYVAEGGGWSTSLPSGSTSITQVLGVVTKGGAGGKGLVLNPGPAQLPGLVEGYAWVGDINNQPIQVATSSFGGGSTDITALNDFTASQFVSNSYFATTSSVNDLSSSIYQTDATQSNNFTLLSSSVSADSASFDSRILAAGGQLQILDEGNIQGNATSLNFIGDGVTATISAGTASITIAGGGGSGEVTLGSNTFTGSQFISSSLTVINSVNGEKQTIKLLPFISGATFNGNRDTVITERYATSTDGTTFIPSPTSPTNLVFGRNALAQAQTTITATSIVSGSNNIILSERTAAANGAEIEANNSYISVFPSTRIPAYAPLRINNSTVNSGITLFNATAGLSSSLALGSRGFNYGYAGTVNSAGIFALATLNPNSSSIGLNGSLIAGNTTVTGNKVNPQFTGEGSAFNVVNTVTAGNITLLDQASGSANFGVTSYARNIFGGVVTVTNPIAAATNNNIGNTIGVGNNLVITGSDAAGTSTGGAAFFGKWNLNDGVVNNTANVVFAVGAGTGPGTQGRTPLWVGTDQSVNVTGSLKVTGSNFSIDTDGQVTASTILLTSNGSTAIQYMQPSTGSVMGVFNTSYGKDNLKVYQYQGQQYAFNVNLTADQINAYTGSQFRWGLQLNGSDVSLPGGGGTYFSMVSGSTTGSGEPGQDKKGLNYLGTSMILDVNADTSFRRKVYVEGGAFVSGAAGGSTPALIVDGTQVGNRAIQATGSIDITGSLSVNGNQLGSVGYGSYYTTTTNSGSVLTFLTQESAVGFENVSGSFIRATQSGVYQVTANVDINNAASVGSSEISLKKNGSTITATTFTTWFSNTTTNGGATTTAIVSMNANDYIEVGLNLVSSDVVTVGRVSIVKIA